MSKPRRARNNVNGWLVLDKPVGMTSTQALAVVKRALSPNKAGHAGTLDPLASGLLPIALGEATKTVPSVMDGRKIYRFSVRWGAETTTHDTEGHTTRRSDERPDGAAIAGLLPRFTGTVMQVPPEFSAIKVDGERAYDLARDGETVELEERPVEIHRLELVGLADDDTAVFEAECGKGTYVRALARDFGRNLGCYGHIVELRRTAVGPFGPDDMVPLAAFQPTEADGPLPAAETLLPLLKPVQAALDGWQELSVTRDEAATLLNGQAILVRGRDAPVEANDVFAAAGSRLIATGVIERGRFVPKRVFHL